MKLSEALIENIQELTDKVYEFRRRADEIERNGKDAKITVDNLVTTCDEIGRLHEQLKQELDNNPNG